ncbi:MAG: hypothetical protein CSA66_05345 [Proteobacteria bacterium]|nr:MAG: hypothetical protein CSA66_05345 [Pseudomonadota bacterium]
MMHLLLLPALLGAFALPDGLAVDDAVKLAGDITYYGLQAPEEVVPGGTLAVTVYLSSKAPLGADIWSFVHLESKQSACRLVQDEAPSRADDGGITHTVTVSVPKTGPCAKPQRLEIFTGLYKRPRGPRVRVIDPPSAGDRIYAGHVEIVAEDADSDRVAFAPSEMEDDKGDSILRPWRPWIWSVLTAILVALLLAWLVNWREGAAPTPPRGPWEPQTRRERRIVKLLTAVALVVPLLLSVLAALDFVKDDAYISFRVAHNFVRGEGLVFNTGEHLEGITNFLWTLVLVPFEALGLDLFQVAEVLGTGLAIGLLLCMTRISVLINGFGRDLSHLWGGVWLATSSSLGLWSTSGMEQPLAMFLPVASAWLLWRSWSAPPREDDATATRKRRRDGLWSGVLMGLGCLTRPEVHLIGIIMGLPLVVRAIKERRLDRVWVNWAIGLLAVTVPAHAFRLLYYGSLVPNTFYVKTGASELVLLSGLDKLYDMFSFNNLGVLLVLAPLAFASKRRLTEKLVMLAVSLGFMGYIVKVGADEMRWHRLYLPALPFLVMLAALGLQNFVLIVTRLLKRSYAPVALFAAGWIVVLFAAWSSLSFTFTSMGGFNGRGDLSGNYHPDIGKFVTRHDRPGALVAFQDMGSTPYHAPDLNFLDFIGLVDATVAHARYDYGLHAFLATENQRNKPKFNADMREYFWKRNPEWTILTTYVHSSHAKRVSERFAKDPVPKSLGSAVRHNGYQFGIYNKRFEDSYVHVRTWPRSAGYYLSLFRRKDLWEQTPGEVVLDAVPEGIGGVKGELDRGLELLGSEHEREATRKHEFFLTTWWRVPGPMEPDTFFFFHIEAEGFRLPYDAIPGDWMYPADRWEAGQIIENRVLVQLPPRMKPGEYDIYMGVYRRSTGQRLAVVSGPNDGANRVHLGKVTVTPLVPPFDHLIKPTDVDEQRKYPERIIPHGRQPGE